MIQYGDLVRPTVFLRNPVKVNSEEDMQYDLVVPYILSNKTNASAPIYIRASGSATVVRADLSNPSQGNDVIFNVLQNSVIWASFIIPEGSGSYVFSPTQVAALATLTIGNQFFINITQVGGIYPGSTLVVTVIV